MGHMRLLKRVFRHAVKDSHALPNGEYSPVPFLKRVLLRHLRPPSIFCLMALSLPSNSKVPVNALTLGEGVTRSITALFLNAENVVFSMKNDTYVKPNSFSGGGSRV